MRKKLTLIFISVVVSVFLFPYIHVEFLTNLHGHETKLLYRQTGIISSNNYQKILQYSEDKARVLYATTDDISECKFVKKDDLWVLESWRCISSKNGSASGLTFPIYWYKMK